MPPGIGLGPSSTVAGSALQHHRTPSLRAPVGTFDGVARGASRVTRTGGASTGARAHATGAVAARARQHPANRPISLGSIVR
jgi:hypothetical protein